MENHEQQRIRAAQLMQSRAGLNGYTQGSKRKYFWGYPDNEVGNTSQCLLPEPGSVQLSRARQRWYGVVLLSYHFKVLFAFPTVTYVL